MARQRKIVFGGTTIDLLNIAGWISPRGGAGEVTLPDSTVQGEEEEIAERHVLDLVGTSTDGLAAKIVELVNVLRAAARHAKDPDSQPTPVYLIDQLTGESNPRYALVTGALEISHPDLLTIAAELNHFIEKNGVTIVRRHPWADGIPGSLPSPKTLAASDGPASPTLVHIANFRDTNALTHVFAYDTSANTYSANLLSAGGALFPAAPAVGDMLLIGSTQGPWHHAVIEVTTAGVFACTMSANRISAAGPPPTCVALAAGSEFTLYPYGGPDSIFKAIAAWVVNIKPPNTWAAVTLNGQLCWWAAVKIDAFTSMATIPVASNTIAMYAQKTDHVEIPAAAFQGDMPPVISMEFSAPHGGTTTPNMGSLSRILAGAKHTGLAGFVAALNWGGLGNPAGWALTPGTDATATVDPEAPGGSCLAISFATSSAMVVRGTLLGTSKYEYWRGSYRPFLTVKQIGGSPGDIRLKLRAGMISTGDEWPKLDVPQTGIKTKSVDLGYEIMDLSPEETLRIPFAAFTAADPVTADILFQVMAERLTGAGTIRLGMVWLQPLNPWSVQLDDPVFNRTLGTSALRGWASLLVDGGVTMKRTVKYIGFPTENWLGGRPLKVEPATQTRIYFLMGHYPTTWGDGPLLATLGQHLGFRLYGFSRYTILKGAS